jgi:hypothetical protein
MDQQDKTIPNTKTKWLAALALLVVAVPLVNYGCLKSEIDRIEQANTASEKANQELAQDVERLQSQKLADTNKAGRDLDKLILQR